MPETNSGNASLCIFCWFIDCDIDRQHSARLKSKIPAVQNLYNSAALCYLNCMNQHYLQTMGSARGFVVTQLSALINENLGVLMLDGPDLSLTYCSNYYHHVNYVMKKEGMQSCVRELQCR